MRLPNPNMTKQALSVFFSYCHKDEDLQKDLDTHLFILKRQDIINTWHDRRITSGKELDNEISENLKNADIILLLISADFLASRYCYEIELKRAMIQHDEGKSRVIPIILRACSWKNAPFAKLKALPNDGKAVTLWSDRDAAFNDVVNGIERTISEIIESKLLLIVPPESMNSELVRENVKAQPPINLNSLELLNAKTIIYQELEKLLKAKEWKLADQLTHKLMTQIAGVEKECRLREEDIKLFPCEDLLAINYLWKHNSNGKFGFSSQKKLWLEYGGKPDKYDYEIWKKFGTQVGWYDPKTDDWLSCQKFINSTKNVDNSFLEASLPRSFVGGLGRMVFMDGNGLTSIECLFSRMEDCEILEKEKGKI